MKGRLNQRVYAANAMLTALDFEKLGFWEDTTPEENITVYGMDFDDDYILLTAEDGKTVVDPKKYIVVAAYDQEDCFLWGVEQKNCSALEELCAQSPAGSSELLEALRTYILPNKYQKSCSPLPMRLQLSTLLTFITLTSVHSKENPLSLPI